MKVDKRTDKNKSWKNKTNTYYTLTDQSEQSQKNLEGVLRYA